MSDRIDYDKQAREKGIALARQVSSDLNNFGNEPTIKAFLDAMSREHRTLQQSWSGVVFRWIEILAQKADSRDYDGRNEYSVKLAQRIRDTLKLDKHDFRPPMI